MFLSRLKSIYIVLAILVCGTFLLTTHDTAHAESVVITSPSNGQEFSGNDFTISGNSDPNVTVLVMRNGLTLTQTRSDNNGAWSVNVTGLPDGNNTITARSIKNTGYAYYVSSNDQGDTTKINRIRLTDDAINGDNFPITTNDPLLFLAPSKVNGIFYQMGSYSNNSYVPAKFDSANPSVPVAASGYPANAFTAMGAYSSDGTKLFSPNTGLQSVSVIDVANNQTTTTIEVGFQPNVTVTSQKGEIYQFPMQGDSVAVINPTTNQVDRTIDVGCDGRQAISAAFSDDAAYPYYYVFCIGSDGDSQRVSVMSVATDQSVTVWDSDTPLTNAVLSLDNSKIYAASSSGIPNNSYSDKIFVLNPSNGQFTTNIQLAAGALGIFQSPDGQNLYVATPGAFNSTGIDKIDTLTNAVEHIDTGNEVAAAVTFSVSTAATVAEVNLSVVLGVATASTPVSQLAKTGVFVALASPVGLLLIAGTVFTYYDYRRHKQPLLAVDDSVQYSYFHHLKVVSLPVMKYRFSVGLDRKVDQKSGTVRRF